MKFLKALLFLASLQTAAAQISKGLPTVTDFPSQSPKPSDIPSNNPTRSIKPSASPSSLPSSDPSDLPSMVPSFLSSSEPSWSDDDQCKKKNPKNDTCTKLGGRCKIDCEDDENYDCVPDLCSYNKKWDKPNKKLKLRELMTNEEEIVEMEISAIGNTDRKLKTPKAPKAPKATCACRVPKNE